MTGNISVITAGFYA